MSESRPPEESRLRFHASDETRALCPSMLRTCLCFSTSHSCTLWSEVPTAKRLDEGPAWLGVGVGLGLGLRLGLRLGLGLGLGLGLRLGLGLAGLLRPRERGDVCVRRRLAQLVHRGVGSVPQVDLAESAGG